MTQYPATRSGFKESYANVARPKQKDEDVYVTGSYEEGISEKDDTEWEDEEELRRLEERKSQTSTRSSPRKRRRGTYITQSQARKPSYPPSPRPIPVQEPIPVQPKNKVRPIISGEEVLYGAMDFGVFGARYVYDVFQFAIKLLRTPLSILVFLWLLSFIIGRLSHSIRVAFSPICIVPGISSSPWCRPIGTDGPSGRGVAKWADFPKLMDVQSKTFQDLMFESVGAPALSLEIKRAEMATKDLVVGIKHSDLASKDSLELLLNEFVADARKTGDGLGKLASKVGGSVDSIMAANDWAIKSIESARASQPSPWSAGAIVPWMRPKHTVNEIVTETFEETMDLLSRHMERLIVEAGVNLQNLYDLEERLNALKEVVYREDSTVSTAKIELLAGLWTKLGGNRNKMRNFEKNLSLLKDLGQYREEALARVVATLVTLRSMRDDMEDMRERVAAPDLAGSSVPVEVHMKSIRIGLERLREGRVKAKRLEDEALRRVRGFAELDDGGDR